MPDEMPPDLAAMFTPHAPPRAHNHRWALNLKRVARGDVRASLEAERDHYARTTLVAGPDPREPSVKLMVHEFEVVVEHMTRAIDGAVAAIASETAEFLHVTVRGWTRTKPPSDQPGSTTTISVSVAEQVEPEPFVD